MENLFINRFMHMFQSSWSDFADFEKIFVRISNTISERVMNHWQEDRMFGYQFLNGCNPVMIQRCLKLPDNLPVTTEMVECSLERQLTLEQEIEQGNIFIVDFKLLDGIDANKTDPCTLQFLAAPICLLYKNLANKIVPIAIQLNQVPGEENPIFLPSDAKYDWLLAKIWVRSSDFHVHQTITHLLRTHLVSEVFGIAMYRQLPAVHPIFKLFLGMYPEEHFVEKPVKEAMARFRKNLDSIVSVIAERNKNKKLPYYYLSPDRIPNSVAI